VYSVKKFKELEWYVTQFLNNDLQVNLFQSPAASVELPPFIKESNGFNKAHFENMVFNQMVPTVYFKNLLSPDNQELISRHYELKTDNTIQNECIEYAFVETMFGPSIMAQTQLGLCAVELYESENQALVKIRERFPKNKLVEVSSTVFEKVKQNMEGANNKLKLHLQGTDFQIGVWRMLLQIPIGVVMTYMNLANSFADEKSSRAVGAAVGQNPIAIIIPCHRVVHTNGKIGHYMWGQNKKIALLVHELLLSK
jgi:O-6-methylguanine DNA methyltransferase